MPPKHFHIAQSQMFLEHETLVHTVSVYVNLPKDPPYRRTARSSSFRRRLQATHRNDEDALIQRLLFYLCEDLF